MKIVQWFDSSEARSFAKELATFITSELSGKLASREQFKAKAGKTLVQAARRLQDFQATHRLNFLTRSRLANAFLWALKDSGCPEDYANELTEWLTIRL